MAGWVSSYPSPIHPCVWLLRGGSASCSSVSCDSSVSGSASVRLLFNRAGGSSGVAPLPVPSVCGSASRSCFPCRVAPPCVLRVWSSIRLLQRQHRLRRRQVQASPLRRSSSELLPGRRGSEAVWLRLAPLLTCYVSTVGLHRRPVDPQVHLLREGRRFRSVRTSRLVRHDCTDEWEGRKEGRCASRRRVNLLIHSSGQAHSRRTQGVRLGAGRASKARRAGGTPLPQYQSVTIRSVTCKVSLFGSVEEHELLWMLGLFPRLQSDGGFCYYSQSQQIIGRLLP